MLSKVKNIYLSIALLLSSFNQAMPTEQAQAFQFPELYKVASYLAYAALANIALARSKTLTSPEIYLQQCGVSKKNLMEPNEEQQKQINEFLEKAGINPQKVIVKLLCADKLRALGGLGGACFGKNYLIIDPEALNSDSSRFVIAHEAMHAKNSDNTKLLASIPIAILLAEATVWMLSMGTSKALNKEEVQSFLGRHKSTSKFIAHPFLLFFILITIKANISHRSFFAYFRSIEKRADIDAARALGSSIGGVKFCKEIKEKHLALKNDNPLLYNGRIKDNGDNVSDVIHPPLSERIKYLEELQKEFDAKAAQTKPNLAAVAA